MLGETEIDMLGPPQPHVFAQAPQGLYSRVRFELNEVRFRGEYGSNQVQAQIDKYVATIDLRDPIGRKVGPGQSAIFTVTFDGTAWLDDLLAHAESSDNQILI